MANWPMFLAVFTAGVLTEAPINAIRTEISVVQDKFGPEGMAIVGRLVMFPFSLFVLYGYFLDGFPLGMRRYQKHAVNAAVCTMLCFGVVSFVLGVDTYHVLALTSFGIQIGTCFVFLSFYRFCVDLMAAAKARVDSYRGDKTAFVAIYLASHAVGRIAGDSLAAFTAYEWTRTFSILCASAAVVNLVAALKLPAPLPLRNLPAFERGGAVPLFVACIHGGDNMFLIIFLCVSAAIPSLDATALYVERNFANATAAVQATTLASNLASACGALLGIAAFSKIMHRTPHAVAGLGFVARVLCAVPYLILFLGITSPDALSEGANVWILLLSRACYAFSRQGLRAVFVGRLFVSTDVHVSGMVLGFAFTLENILTYGGDMLAVFISSKAGVSSGDPRAAFLITILYMVFNGFAGVLCLLLYVGKRMYRRLEDDTELMTAFKNPRRGDVV